MPAQKNVCLCGGMCGKMGVIMAGGWMGDEKGVWVMWWEYG